MKIISFLFLFFSFLAFADEQNIQKYDKGYRYDKEGWIFVHIEGSPYERGVQHGYLLADAFDFAFKCYKEMTFQTTGVEMSFFIKEAVEQHKSKIPPEYLDEMKGIADGLNKKGISVTLDDIIGWNSYIDVATNWWPTESSNFAKYLFLSKCSAFIATGSKTKDGKIVISHNTFDQFWNAQVCNVILDVAPDKGHHFVMQTSPGYIASMTDFYINDAGLTAVETTMSGFNGYFIDGNPSYVNGRNAIQYSDSIDSFVAFLNDKNNAGNPASWLIGDIKTNEIAEYELGLNFQSLNKKTDGYFFGCNVAFDPKIRNLECSNTGFNDIRQSTGGRRVRFMELFEKEYDKIDVDSAKKIASDHYDVFLKKVKPGPNTICTHDDETDTGINKDPFSPSGAVDSKIATADMIKEMKFLAIWGRACGTSFDADKFLKQHPQFGWQKGYLLSRPSRKWTEFGIRK